MKIPPYVIPVFLMIVFLIALGGVVYTIVIAVKGLLDLTVAIVGAAATLGGAIVTHSLTLHRDQLDAQRRLKQENYLQLLNQIDDVIRYPRRPSDNFSKIHLASWISGSEKVVLATQELLDASDPEARLRFLNQLVLAMRKDIGLDKLSSELKLEGIFLPLSEPDSLPQKQRR